MTPAARLLASAALLTLSCALAAPDRALLALDRVIDGDLVASVNVTVTYTVHNVGTRVAEDVSLRDHSFPASRFELHGGAPRRSWAALAPRESGVLALVVSPRRAGELIVAPASVTYRDGGETRVTRVAAADTIAVEDLLSWRRRTDKHAAEWGVFAGAFALLVVAPFVVSGLLEGGVPGVKKKAQ